MTPDRARRSPVEPAAGVLAEPAPGRLALALRARLGGLPREYWLLWTGTLVNRLGTFVGPFLILYLTRERGLSESGAGAVVALHGAGSVVSQLVGGVLADRIGRRATLSLGMVSFAASLGVLGFARSLPMIVAGAVLTGLAGDLHRPAAQALVADVVPPKDRARAFGLQFWAINLGFAIATLLAGVMATHGYGLLFAGDAATSLVFAVVIWRGLGETRPPRPANQPAGSADSLLTVLRDRLMVALVLCWLAYAVVYFQSFTTLPLAMRRDGLGPAAFGLAIACNGIVIVLVQPLVAPWLDRLPRVRALAASMLLVGLGFGLTAFADTTWQYTLTVVVWTLGEIGAASTGFAIVADIAPAHLRGRYAGAFGFSFGGSAVLAPLVGTQVLHGFGPTALWTGTALLGAAAAAGQLSMGPAIARRTAAVAKTEAAATPG